MSRRRGVGDTLTGGTGDINPQFITVKCKQTGTDTLTTTQVSIPIDRFHQGYQRSGVIEILAIRYYFQETNGNTNGNYQAAAVSTVAPTTTPTYADTHTIDIAEWSVHSVPGFLQGIRELHKPTGLYTRLPVLDSWKLTNQQCLTLLMVPVTVLLWLLITFT